MSEPKEMAALAAGWMGWCAEAGRLHRVRGPRLGGMLLESFVGWEALNEPYEYRVQVLSLRADHVLEDWLDSRAEVLTVGAQGQLYRVSGHIAQARALASDGALARYELLIVPWLWRLRLGGRQRAWQHCSLRQIIDDVFAQYQPQAAWRWSPEVHAHLQALGPWDYVVQGRESDLAFVQRLLARAGLGLRFEEVDGVHDDAPALGHRAVIFAHSPDEAACPQHPDSARGGGIAYRSAHSQQPGDGVQTYHEHASHTAAQHTALGWHERAKRALAAQAVGAAAAAAAYEDYEPHSAAPDEASAAARARLRGQALQTQALHYSGLANVRGARCGQWWQLQHLPERGAQQLLLTELLHVGCANLPHAVQRARARLGPPLQALDCPLEPALWAQAQASGYAQHWRAVPRQQPWRPLRRPAPRATGAQSAVVVGPDGQPQAPAGSALYTDRLGRIKVRFHWQHDLQHDLPHDLPHAPTRGGSRRCSDHSVWVRVAQRWAAGGMGAHFLPRIGDEVLVDFLDGDLERPVVVGVLHNGRGAGAVPATPGGRRGRAAAPQPFAGGEDHRSAGQANEVAGGHSPAWHGAAPSEHAHAGALSGVQSRELGAGPGANRLVFDDSPGQLRVQAASSAHASWLSLGHLVHQAGNRRGSARGLGLELRSDAYGALRGARGLLLSSYGQAPEQPAGDPSAGLALLQQALTQAQQLDQASRRHRTAALSAAQEALQGLQRSLQGQVGPDAAAQAAQTPPGHGALPHSATPVLQAQARAQHLWVAGQDLMASAEHGVHLGAGQDHHQHSGGAWRAHSGQALSVLAGAAALPQQPGGLHLVAAQGPIELQAHSDRLELAAQQALELQSASAQLQATAARTLTLATAGGARITLQACGLSVQCPGTLRVQAAQIRMVGPARLDQALPAMPKTVCIECLKKSLAAAPAFTQVE
ncbi:MAG: type IV secretion protein Rhs [Caldimonas sp.]|nr:MAG: type IV secretion protein Rhs [Caldimonas sp.]